MKQSKLKTMNCLTEEDFTSDEVIDSFQKGDNTIDIVGIVTFTNNNFQSPANAKFQKIVCSNKSLKKVQIIAWNEWTSKLDRVRVGTTVYISSLKYNVPRNKDYNSGNVNFELLVKENSEVQIFETCSTTQPEPLLEEVSITDAYNRIGEKLKLDVVIKTEPGEHKGKSFSTNTGSVTNTSEQLEFKLNFALDKLKDRLLKGTSVEITGIMERYRNGPPILCIDSPDNIKVLDRPRVSFLDVLTGFRTKTNLGE